MPRRNKRKHKGAEPGTLGAGGGKGGPGENWGGEHMRQAPRPLIAVNPDRTLIAVAFGTEVRVFDTESGALATLESTCAFDAAAAAAREGGADAPDASRWHTDAIRALRFDSTGASMCTAGDDKLARVWQVGKATGLRSDSTGASGASGAVAPRTLTCVRCARLPKKACAAAFAAGGAVAAFADKFGDVHGLPVTVTDRKHTKAHGGAAAPDEMDESTYLFGHCCSIITAACAPCSADENAEENFSLLATADRDFKIRVARLPKDVATILDPDVGVPEIQSFCHGHAAFVACVAAVPAGQNASARIVSGGGDGAARLWRCEDGAALGAVTLAAPRARPEGDDATDATADLADLKKEDVIATGEAPREAVDAPAVVAVAVAASGVAYAAVENRPGEVAELRVRDDALELVRWVPLPDGIESVPAGLHYDETRGELLGVCEKTRPDGNAEAALFFAYGPADGPAQKNADAAARALAVPGMDAVPGISLGDAMRKRGYDEQKREARKMQRKDFKSGGASLSNA